jgi:HK97 family phage major capsid protein
MRSNAVRKAGRTVFETKEGEPHPSQTPELQALNEVRQLFTQKHAELKSFIDKANGELDESKKVAKETKDAIDKTGQELKELAERLSKIEAKANRLPDSQDRPRSLGAQFVDLAEYKAMREGGTVRKARLETKAITNQLPLSNDQPLVQADRIAGIISNPNRTLRIRDLLPVGTTSSNLVEFTKEDVFTNSAGPQVGGSPTVQAEGTLKNESDITFVLANAPVITLAHFIVVSRQVLDDASMLQSYIEGRLSYGLKLEEEDEILNGDGQFGTLSGLWQNRTAYNRAKGGDTRIDTLRRSITQVQLSEYTAEAFILNPEDWEEIELTKDNDGRYILANPQSLAGSMLWGRPVVATNSMPKGRFLTANFSLAAQLWDRQQAAVELSREDSDNFRKNLVTLLAEERLALTVYRSAALVGGNF